MPRKSLTPAQAQQRIAVLARTHVTPFSDREDLGRKLDKRIYVDRLDGRVSVQLMLEGMKVSWTGIYDFAQQVRGAVLRMGGIAGVGTHAEHRFKGYSSIVMENASRWMRAEGYDVAMLYGITGFYGRFGYAEAFPSVWYELPVAEAERAKSSNLKFVPFADEHLSAVLEMYNRSNVGRTGPTLRPMKAWVPFRRDKPWGLQVTAQVGLDRAGHAVAYLAHDTADPASIVEVGYRGREAFGDLVRQAAALAWAQRKEKITFILAYDEPLMDWAAPLGLTKHVHWRTDGGGMVRIINLSSVLRKIGHGMARRLGGSGQMLVKTNLETVLLRWKDDAMEVVESPRTPRQAARVGMPQWALAQLIYGYRSASLLAQDGVLRAERPVVALLDQMLPAMVPYHSRVDVF